MSAKSKVITLGELAREVSRGTPIEKIVRPASGWLRTLRDALGLTLTDLAQRMKVTPPAIRSFEQAEAEDRITLASLRRCADAMSCDLVYALVPRTDTLDALANATTKKLGHTRTATPAPPSEAHDVDFPASKVTDKTWHALHGES